MAALVVGGYLAGRVIRGSGGAKGATVQQVSGSTQSNRRYPGATVMPPEPRPSITFRDTAGQSYNIATRTEHKVTLLYFGYTNCPNLCPINMALAAKALEQVPPRVRSQVTVLFVTIDPRRDTPAVLRRWLDKFDSSFVGLRGTVAQVHRAETDVGQPLSYIEGSATGDYQFEHAGIVIGYGRSQPAYLQFDVSETVGQYARSLEHLVKYGYRT